MLLNLLKRLDVSKICLAGFDGLKENEDNYIDAGFPNVNDGVAVKRINKEVEKLYGRYKNKVAGKIDVLLLTPSIYE